MTSRALWGPTRKRAKRSSSWPTTRRRSQRSRSRSWSIRSWQARLFPRIFGVAQNRRHRIQFDEEPARAHGAHAGCMPSTARNSTKSTRGTSRAAVGLKALPPAIRSVTRSARVLLETMDFPEPVIKVAIETKTKAGQEKMGIALSKLAEEDPTFKAYTDEETGQTIIAGMGELHLEIIVGSPFKGVQGRGHGGKPQVAYKETITKKYKAEGRYIRQTGEASTPPGRRTPNRARATSSCVGALSPGEYPGHRRRDQKPRKTARWADTRWSILRRRS